MLCMVRELFSKGLIGHRLSRIVIKREMAVGISMHSPFYPDKIVLMLVRRNLKNQAFEPYAVDVACRTSGISHLGCPRGSPVYGANMTADSSGATANSLLWAGI